MRTPYVTIRGGRLALIATALAVTLASQAVPQKDEPFDYLRKDERLAAELTLRLNGEALKAVADIIEAATAAKISVDQDIAEDKVTVFCKGQPASEVMIQIAKLFGYHFRPERRADEVWYLLFRDDAARALERNLRTRAVDEAFDKVGKTVDRYAQSAATQESFEQLRESVGARLRELWTMPEPRPEEMNEELIEKMTPVFEDFAYAGFVLSHRGVPLLYSRLGKEQVEMLKDGRKVVFSTRPLRGAYDMPDDLAEVFTEDAGVSPLDELTEEMIDLGGLDHLEAEGDEAETETPGAPVAVRVEFDAQIQEDGFPALFLEADVYHIDENGEEAAAASGCMTTPIGMDLEEAMRHELGLYRQMAERDAGDEDAASRQDDPMLQTKVRLSQAADWMPEWTTGAAGEEEGKAEEAPSPEDQPTSETSPANVFREHGLYTVSHLLEDLAPQVPASLIADHYDGPFSAPPGRSTFAGQIDRMRAAGFDLTRENGWFRFRNRTWYLYRASQIPNHLILRWFGAQERKGGIDLTELAEMALLPKDQLRSISDPSYGGLLSLFESLEKAYLSKTEWSWIKAYALCTDEQQRRMLLGEEVSVASMPRPAQDALAEVLEQEAGLPIEQESWDPQTLTEGRFSVTQKEHRTYKLRQGTSDVEEVAMFQHVPLDEESFEAMLNYLQSRDPAVGPEDFEIGSSVGIAFRLDGPGPMVDIQIALPCVEKRDSGD